MKYTKYNNSSTHGKEMRLCTYDLGDKVICQLNDNKLRTGTITFIGSQVKIKDSKTDITQSVPLKNVIGHFHF